MSYPVSTSIHLYFDHDYKVSINEQIKKHTDAGFKFLDFNFLDWQNDDRSPLINDGWEEWILSAKKTAEENGAIFNQAHAPVPCLRFHSDYNGLVKACKKAIKGCSLLGIRQMVYHALVYPKDFGLDMSWLDANKKFFGELIEDAKKYNVGICIENTWPTCKILGRDQWNTEVLLELVDSFNDDIVGVCWDTGHGNLTGNGHNYNGQNVPELLPYGDQYENITKIGKRLRTLHINDNNGMDDDHIMPGTGTINWDDVIRALDDIGYEYSFTLEAHRATRGVPAELKDNAVKLLHDVAVAIANRSKNGRVYDN